MFRKSLSAFLITLPCALFADSQLERLETISEQMNDAMFDMMIRTVQDNGGDPAELIAAKPEIDWDDEYREAGKCLLERMTDLSSPADVDTMLDEMEAMIPKLATQSMEDMADNPSLLPDGVTEEQSMAITNDCGMVEVSLKRMEESGFSAAMMKAMSQ